MKRNKVYIREARNEDAPELGPILPKTNRAPLQRLVNVLMIDTSRQRQGHGRHLVTEAANRLIKQGMKTMLVGVEQRNPNRSFYEHIRAIQDGERPLDWAGFQTKEILYRWEDLDELSRLTPS